MRIAINGFGRIGRTVLRQILSLPAHHDIEVALINDIAPVSTCAYLFQYDSTFGPLPEVVHHTESGLTIGDRHIPFFNSNTLEERDLSDIDVVLECTGSIKSREHAECGLTAGARAVLISGPSNYADITIVRGANEEALGDAKVVSNSSCTTNAIAPLLRAIDATAGIDRGHITTIHCYTGSQPMVDAPRGDLARSRAGAESMVPTTTSAASELRKVLPSIGARTSVSAVRVPCLSVSAVDATLQLTTTVDVSMDDFIRQIARDAGVIGVTADPCVSRDFRARPESLVLALPETTPMGAAQLRIFGWYDNEWGFSARMIDMARKLSNR